MKRVLIKRLEAWDSGKRINDDRDSHYCEDGFWTVYNRRRLKISRSDLPFNRYWVDHPEGNSGQDTWSFANIKEMAIFIKERFGKKKKEKSDGS